MSEPSATRAVVLSRRRKGRPNAAVTDTVQQQLRDAGWEVESRVVKRKRQLRRLARKAAKRGVDVVVAVGGDGAVVQVATALATTETALGIIPTGTGNLLAGNLGIPHPVAEAAQTVLEGSRRRIDFGRLTVGGKERGFAVACGIGFDATVMAATSTRQKLRWGKLAYLKSVMARAGTLRNATHEITVDGESRTLQAAQVFVANLGRMLPLVEPRLPIVDDDGLLDVLVIKADGPIPGLVAGWEALTQKDLGETGRVIRATAKDVMVDARPSRLVEADGSVVGRTPVRISILPAALTVVVPSR